jgi:uncharacterized protein (DUF58 family)
MNYTLYSIYKHTSRYQKNFLGRFTIAGRFMLSIALFAAILGLDTQKTMIYQIASFVFFLLIISYLQSLKHTVTISLKRNFPETCTAGEKLYYTIYLENNGKRDSHSLFYKDEPGDPVPTYLDFINTPEDGEEKRNWFDRRAGYYRWLWMIKKNIGANFKTHKLPALKKGEKRELEIWLTPRRRGYIHISGYTIERHDPAGLMKKEIFIKSERNILVLPKIYDIPLFEFSGSRKYHQGGITAAMKRGDSDNFVALREYQPGDPVKHIDWKSSARTHSTVVKEYQDEYFSRYGLILDTFCKQVHSDIFEEAVSIAASILTNVDLGNSVLDLMFVGTEHFTATSGRGIAEQRHMLEILASVSTCRDKTFNELTNLIKNHVNLLSGLAIVLIDIDKERKELINFLAQMKIPFKAMVISESKEITAKKISDQGINHPITIIEKDKVGELIIEN